MGIKSVAAIISAIITMTFSSVFPSNFNVEEKIFSLGYTHRWDSLNWNFGDFDGVPNILSELVWDDLYINQVAAAATLKMCNGLFFKVSGDYGQIYSGKNLDSDYAENDRQEEFSRAIADAGRGEVFDLSAAVGYQATFFCDQLKITPLAGVSWNEQHLQIFDGEQLIPLKKDINGLHSCYKTRWYGPWIGFDCSMNVYGKFIVFGSVEYHWTEYRGCGHWNLRTDFLTDFKHESNGDGVYIMSGVSYLSCGNWQVDFMASYREWEANGGRHSLTVDVSGIGPQKEIARLNRVSWRSFTLTSLLTYNF